METEHLATALLALALLAPTGAAEPLVDQVDNGQFEEWEDGDPVDWRNVSGDVERTDESIDGSAAMLNAVGDVTTTTLAQEVSLDNEDAPIVPNEQYDFDFAADLNDGTVTGVTSPPEAFGQIVWKNALGETSRVDQVLVADEGGYEWYNTTFQAPEDATAADIQFHLVRDELVDPTDANLKVDDVAFGPADPLAE